MADFVHEATVTVAAVPPGQPFAFADPGFASALAAAGISSAAAKDKTHCTIEGRIARHNAVERMPMRDQSGTLIAEGLHFEWSMNGLDGAPRSGPSHMPTVPGYPPPPTEWPVCNMEATPVTLKIRWTVRGA